MNVRRRHAFAILVLTVLMTGVCTYLWEHGLEAPVSRALGLSYDLEFEESERWRFILTSCAFSVLSLVLPGALLMRMVGRLSRAYRRLVVSEERSQTLARHDALTGLLNRRVFVEEVTAAIGKVQGRVNAYAVLLIDLDHFKSANDMHGHAAGDAVLQAVAERLTEMFGEKGVVARLGGDEFAVLLPVSGGLASLMSEVERLSARLAAPLHWADVIIRMSASIGVALFPADAQTADALLIAADTAMYRAKKEQRGTFRFFEPAMENERLERRVREEELRTGIAAGEVRPYYQPLIRFADDGLCGFEILARWHHPHLGVLPPSEFIQLAEDTGQITALTESILRQACQEMKAWPDCLRFAINVSPVQLGEPLLAERLIAIVVAAGIDTKRIEIEITEDAILDDHERACEVMAAFRRAGMTIALDDFGTGFSSLSNLRQLRFDKVKIDRSFVQTMLESEESGKLVDAILALAASFKMKVTAEGIESREAARMLSVKGCTQGQGFFFGKPIPSEQVSVLVAQGLSLAA